MNEVIVSSVILLAKTETPGCYLFGAYDNQGKATSFLQLPEDHSFFVETLRGQQTIMGRATLEATPLDFPDDGRICVTHHPETLRADAIPASSIEEGIRYARLRAKERNQEKVFVIGGADVMRQCLEKQLLDEVLLTLTETHIEKVPNPVYLNFSLSDWKIIKDSGLLIGQDSNPVNLKFHYYTLWR